MNYLIKALTFLQLLYHTSILFCCRYADMSLRWRHNDHAGVSNHQPPGCLLNRLFRRKSKKTSKLRVTGLCAGNSPGTGEFSAQMASYAENVSIWWRHHDQNVTVWDTKVMSKRIPILMRCCINPNMASKFCEKNQICDVPFKAY